MEEEFDEDAVYRNPACEKWEYKKIIHDPEGKLDASPRWSFYSAAKECVRRLAEDANFREDEALAALYLFRHYLELSLKGLVSGLRHLKNKNSNTPPEGVIEPSPRHNIEELWAEVTNQSPKKLGSGVWSRWDHKFVNHCIQEFHQLDPTSERLRYIREKQPVERERFRSVRVDWKVFLTAMEHVYSVLEEIDTYIIETHGLNADWENEQNSW